MIPHLKNLISDDIISSHPFAQLDFGPLRKRPANDARRSLTEMLPLSVNRQGNPVWLWRASFDPPILGDLWKFISPKYDES